MENPYFYFYNNKEKIHSTKLNALLYAFNTNSIKDISFNIPNLEKSFESVDLSLEPEETLQELYVQRAIDIRNRYDYIVLFYSGGLDSHNILETFMFNNIFIDELVVYDLFNESHKNHLKTYNSEFFSYINNHGSGDEIEKSAIPLAKYFIETYSPKTKLTYFPNLQVEHLKFWDTLDLKKDNRINNTELLLNKDIIRGRNPNIFNENWKNLKNTKKVVHLWGREKPDVRKDDFGYYFSFNDTLFHIIFDNNFSLSLDELPNTHEYFYIHPNACKLFLKQAHRILNELPKVYIDKADNRDKQNTISNIIYNIKTKLPYQAGKAVDIFTNYNKDPKSYKSVKKLINFGGILYVTASYTVFPSFFLDNPTLKLSCNYHNLINLIKKELFKDVSTKYLLDIASYRIITKKFYIKKFN